MLGELHDVGDYKNTNHDVGAIMWYLKVPLKQKNVFFFHCCYKNGYSPFKCNFLLVKFCGPPQKASWVNFASKTKNCFEKDCVFDLIDIKSICKGHGTQFLFLFYYYNLFRESPKNAFHSS